MLSAIHFHAQRVIQHALEDAHHLGLAILPLLLSREFAVAVLSVIVVLSLLALQSILTGPAVAALAVMPAEVPEGAEDTP